VIFEALSEGASKRDDDQWNDCCGEDRVRNEQRNINFSEPRRVREARCSCLRMICQITDQKQDRACDGSQHATPMRDDVLPANENERHRQQHSTEPVQECVQGR